MKDEKIMDLCMFCGDEPTKECYAKHKDRIEEVKLSNVLSKEELLNIKKR